MDTNIYLRDGITVLVPSLTKIIRHKGFNDRSDIEFESNNLNSFTIDQNAKYTFIGKTQIAVAGSDILYVEFNA
ncbi:hypothetical protein C6P22_03740 [Weissella confusa]|nr:hypothetical protein C6P22_03740 [Weissella confusa]